MFSCLNLELCSLIIDILLNDIWTMFNYIFKGQVGDLFGQIEFLIIICCCGYLSIPFKLLLKVIQNFNKILAICRIILHFLHKRV